MKPLRVAVIGGGHLGKIHARLLAEHEQVQLVAVAEPVESARDEIQSQLGVTTTPDYRSLLELPHERKLDAAIVATPTRSHHAVCCDLLNHGLHVFVEKPIAATLAEAQAICSAAADQDRVLQVGHVERFNPALQAAMPHLHSARRIEARRESSYSGRSTDIGVVLDLMIHDIDIVLSLMQAPVVSVSASGETVVGPHEDTAEARLVFENGSVALLRASRVSRQRQRWATIQTAGQSVTIDYDGPAVTIEHRTPQVRQLAAQLPAMSAEAKRALAGQFCDQFLPLEQIAVEPHNAILQEQRDFFSAIRGGRQPQVTGEAARGALAIAEQIVHAIGSFEDGHRTIFQPAAHRPSTSTQLPMPTRKAG